MSEIFGFPEGEIDHSLPGSGIELGMAGVGLLRFFGTAVRLILGCLPE
jgi:hypothetical protein